MEAYDLGILYGIGGLQHPWLDPVMIGITRLGDVWTMVGVVVAAMAVLRGSGRRREAWAMLFAGVAVALLDGGAKFWVGRARPDVATLLVEMPKWPSFPSGHAMGGLALYGLLGWIAGRRSSPRGLRVSFGLGLALGVLIGFSRVYVGTHYPLDVLAGWIGGAAILLFAMKAAGPLARDGEDG
ncbi:MAG: phosphatase PAP2 family protein [Gemmataceae bacterium]|nr:phosphatase PAP2 family protein [Gemmataceae bacterium]